MGKTHKKAETSTKRIKIQLIAVLFITITLNAGSLEKLQSGTITEKIETMNSMGFSGNKTGFWFFVKYLNYESEFADDLSAAKYRQAAAEALGRIRDDRAVPYLVERYKKEKNIAVKTSIMFSMRFYHESSMSEAVLDGIKSDDSNLKFQSILAAEKIEDDSLASAITSEFDSADKGEIKTTCAYVLFLKTKGETHYKYLLASLKENNADTRYWTAYYLGEIAAFDSANHLIKAIEIESIYWVRRKMEESLAKIYLAEKDRKKISEYNRYEKFIK